MTADRAVADALRALVREDPPAVLGVWPPILLLAIHLYAVALQTSGSHGITSVAGMQSHPAENDHITIPNFIMVSIKTQRSTKFRRNA